MHRLRRSCTAMPRPASDQHGLTLTEVLVGMVIMAVVASTIATLVGAAVRSKMIINTRSADTQTAQATLAWMAERLRNAGFNLQPNAQSQLRCKDRVVNQDATLVPTATSVYVSGEILNTTAGNEDLTIGYYVAPDPVTGNRVVMEYKQPCASGATSVSKYSARLTNPNVNVTDLTFQYFDASGTAIADPTSPTQVRRIVAIKISLTVGATEGTSGTQTQRLSRSVLFWNPEPNANNWVDTNLKY